MSTLKTTNIQHPSATGPSFVLSSDGNIASSIVTNAQAGSYTLALTDNGKQVELSGGGTLTVPLNSSIAFPVGASILIVQTGATQVTIAGASGVTVNSSNGLKMFGQWSTALLIKRATNTWLLAGDTSA